MHWWTGKGDRNVRVNKGQIHCAHTRARPRSHPKNNEITTSGAQKAHPVQSSLKRSNLEQLQDRTNRILTALYSSTPIYCTLLQPSSPTGLTVWVKRNIKLIAPSKISEHVCAIWKIDSWWMSRRLSELALRRPEKSKISFKFTWSGRPCHPWLHPCVHFAFCIPQYLYFCACLLDETGVKLN